MVSRIIWVIRWRRTRIRCIARAAEVEVAVLEPESPRRLVRPWISNGGVGRGVEDLELAAPTSMAPVLSLGFSLPGSRWRDGPPDADDVLVAELGRGRMRLGGLASGSKTTWVRP